MNTTIRSCFNPYLLIGVNALTLVCAGCKDTPTPPIAQAEQPVEQPANPPPAVMEAVAPAPSPSSPVPPDARVVPISGGDAIIEAFFDQNLGALPNWNFIGSDPNSTATQTWCLGSLKWTAGTAGDGPTMKRIYAGSGVPLTSYSQLILSAGLPKGSKVTLSAETDAGLMTKTFVCEVSHTDQFVLPLPEAEFLNSVEITLGARVPGPVEANLLWLGLRDPELAAGEALRWKNFTAQPMDIFIRQTPEPAGAAPLYYLQGSKEGFTEAKQLAAATKANPLKLESNITLEPHLSASSNQNLFGRRTTSLNRLTQTFHYTNNNGSRATIGLIDAAQSAALAGDQQALREVAKAAVQIALIPHWAVDFISNFPDSAWSQRCFVQAQVCEALSIAFDLAGSFLTSAGRELILRRLAQDGLGTINYEVWKHPYIFKCNQLPVFSVGRLAAYSLLEKQSRWGHLKPYTDLAFAELNESLDENFLPDGGFPEGSGYLAYTLDNALPALAFYATARGKPFSEILPPLLSRTDDYIAALRSTEDPTRLIIVGDMQGGPLAPISPSVLGTMSKIRPGGASASMMAALPAAQRRKMDLWALPSPDLAGIDPKAFEPFILLPLSGIAASTRKAGDHLTKLVVIGGPAKAGHNHEDRGSFILEFAGETFAADPGGLTYSDPIHGAMKHAQNHNMLVPVADEGDRPAAANPAPLAVIPNASGDATTFTATLNPGTLWPGHYQSWERTVTSPSPKEIMITDDYSLINASAVEFLWHSPLPAEIENGQVIITGTRGRAIITPPAGSTVEITPSRPLGTRHLATIRFQNNAKSGRLETKVQLEPIQASQ